MSRFHKAWKRTALLWLAAAVAFAAAAPQSTANSGPKKKAAAQPPVIDLGSGRETVSDAPPPDLAAFPTKCDVDGDIYLAYAQLSKGMIVTTGTSEDPVSEIEPDSLDITRYRVPGGIPDMQGRVSRMSFDVVSDGTFYALFNTARRALSGKMIPEWVIAKYNNDGTVDSYIHIAQVPGMQIQPLKIAVFGNGDFLLSGTTVLPDHSLGTFTGLFDQTGDLVRMLSLGKPVTVHVDRPNANPPGKHAKPLSSAKELKAWSNNPVSLASSTLSVSASDGNVYLMQGTSNATLFVIDSQGEVLRHFKVKAPAPGLSPMQMAQAGAGHLFVFYAYLSTGSPEDKHPPQSMITVLSMATGEVTALYGLPKGRMLMPGCAPSSHRFVFVSNSKDGHLSLVTFSTD